MHDQKSSSKIKVKVQIKILFYDWADITLHRLEKSNSFASAIITDIKSIAVIFKLYFP